MPSIQAGVDFPVGVTIQNRRGGNLGAKIAQESLGDSPSERLRLKG
jgi:hypothetical protein